MTTNVQISDGAMHFIGPRAYNQYGFLVPRIIGLHNILLLLFISVLFVSIHTDLCQMLISRFFTLFLIPFVFVFAGAGLLPVTLTQSILGALSAYLCLKTVQLIYYKATGVMGLGDGDPELLAFIGSWIGFTGWWYSLLIGSCVGSIVGIIIMLYTRERMQSLRVPFGPFLATGAIIYTLFSAYLPPLFAIA